jgi:hypothetical protein
MDEERIASKVHSIGSNIKRIDAYLSMILKGEISAESGFSIILKDAKSIAWECEGAFIPEQKPLEVDWAEHAEWEDIQRMDSKEASH